jgi:hypothetical protein
VIYIYFVSVHPFTKLGTPRAHPLKYPAKF